MLRFVWLLMLAVLPGSVGGNMGAAMAADVAVPMLSIPDIQKSAKPDVFQGMNGNNIGAIYFPDQILSIAATTAEGEGQQIITQWSKSHRFILVPFNISVAPKDGFIPESVDVAAAFAGLGELKAQPIIIDVFPSTAFKLGPLQGNASLKLDGQAKFAPAPPALPVTGGVGAELSAGLVYKYAPAYANVTSGFASAHAFWQFRKTQDNYPVGEIPLKLLIAVPLEYKESDLMLNFDVKSLFSGPWWTSGATFVSFVSVIKIPAAP